MLPSSQPYILTMSTGAVTVVVTSPASALTAMHRVDTSQPAIIRNPGSAATV